MRKTETYVFWLLTAALLCAWWPSGVSADEFVGGNCIDFTNLTDTSVCTCYYGTFSNPKKNTGVVDMGSSSINSRHTVHRNTNETDARTGNRLHTIPSGDTASVRLGNWAPGTEGEMIEYTYTPSESDGDMLVLRYAVILANPNSGHTSAQKPRFMLQILDSLGRQVEGRPGCLEADFTAGENASSSDGWNIYNYSTSSSGGGGGGGGSSSRIEVYWKDWTTVFFPLQDYLGQPLRIRLTTKDCAHKSHFGYVYFTIHCRGAKLEGASCGVENTHFEAPDGYTYRWYKKSNPGEVLRNTDGSLKPVNNYDFNINPGDTSVYCVNVYSETGCYVTLEADPNIRLPEARMYEVSREVNGCQYDVTFADTSFIRIIKEGKEQHIGLPSGPGNDVLWQWGDGTADVADTSALVTHSFNGGTYDVKMIVRIDGNCEDTASVRLHLPILVDTISGYDTLQICRGDSVVYHGRVFRESGVDTVAVAGTSGCADAYVLCLEVLPPLSINIPTTYLVCPEEALAVTYQLTSGAFDSLVVESGAEALRAGFRERYLFLPEEVSAGTLLIPLPGSDGPINDLLRAGEYTFTLRSYNSHPECGSPDAVTLRMQVTYPAGSVVQRGSYLFLYNQAHNGGYDWTTSSFQWYCNGKAMDGQTGSQLLMTDTSEGTEYYCVITDAAGNSIPTCPVGCSTPRFTALDDAETEQMRALLLQAGQQVELSGAETAQLFDATGRLLRSYESRHSCVTVEAPSAAGVYLLRAGRSAFRIVVR